MIEEIESHGWKQNLRIRAGGFELVITLDVGPRIIRYAFEDGDNVFKEMKAELGGRGEDDWKLRGGHRFWAAPEGEHCYEPDNGPVSYERDGKRAVIITSPESKAYGFRKKLRVAMDKSGGVKVEHELANTGNQELKLAPWGLSVMRPGGVAIIPQASLGRHPSELPEGVPVVPSAFLPNRNLVLWNYTDLSDPRLELGPSLWRIHQRAGFPATKIGTFYRGGWVGYQLPGQTFCKKIPVQKGKPYPDGGSNLEVFTNPEILEIESLAPAVPIEPGGAVTHTEKWKLFSQHEPLDNPDRVQGFFSQLEV
ncbi:MAG: hypothetical protein AAGK14_11895 [Verrucomicrobiota bacterium]